MTWKDNVESAQASLDEANGELDEIRSYVRSAEISLNAAHDQLERALEEEDDSSALEQSIQRITSAAHSVLRERLVATMQAEITAFHERLQRHAEKLIDEELSAMTEIMKEDLK